MSTKAATSNLLDSPEWRLLKEFADWRLRQDQGPLSLDAIHALEQGVNKDKYCTTLNNVVRSETLAPAPFWWALIHATAAQRTKALTLLGVECRRLHGESQ